MDIIKIKDILESHMTSLSKISNELTRNDEVLIYAVTEAMKMTSIVLLLLNNDIN